MTARPGSAPAPVRVAPERLTRWVTWFGESHGQLDSVLTDAGAAVLVRAADSTTAQLTVPFPPLAVEDGEDPLGALCAHALRERRVGVLLARLGGHAAGVFVGTRLEASKVGASYVQGRTAAGGQSQQRFARRRQGQAHRAHQAAADAALAVIVPRVGTLDGVVLGGSRAAVREVLEDRRLAALRPLVTAAFLDVPDPRLRVLAATPAMFRAVTVRLEETQ